MKPWAASSRKTGRGGGTFLWHHFKVIQSSREESQAQYFLFSYVSESPQPQIQKLDTELVRSRNVLCTHVPKSAFKGHIFWTLWRPLFVSDTVGTTVDHTFRPPTLFSKSVTNFLPMASKLMESSNFVQICICVHCGYVIFSLTCSSKLPMWGQRTQPLRSVWHTLTLEMEPKANILRVKV